MALRESQKLYTVEEFEQYVSLPENQDRRLELEDGMIVELAPSSFLNTVTEGRIIYYLNAVIIPGNLGHLTVPDGGFRLSPSRVRQPDIGFISSSHGLKVEGVVIPITPDLAVEVVSPDEDVFKRAKEFIRAGTRIVWAVYAEDRTIAVFTPAEGSEFRIRELTVNDTLDGGDVLPGFSIPVAQIFLPTA